MKVINEVCPVCHGKGGWKTDKKDYLHYNWMDCPHCDGFGFKEKPEPDSDSLKLLNYAKNLAKLKKELSELANVSALSSIEEGKDLYIALVPKKRDIWMNFVKSLLKYSHYADTIKIDVSQSFFYSGNNYHYYWEVFVDLNSMESVEGLVELVMLYNRSGW